MKLYLASKTCLFGIITKSWKVHLLFIRARRQETPTWTSSSKSPIFFSCFDFKVPFVDFLCVDLDIPFKASSVKLSCECEPMKSIKECFRSRWLPRSSIDEGDFGIPPLPSARPIEALKLNVEFPTTWWSFSADDGGASVQTLNKYLIYF